jgi:hypothetical protein
MKNRADWGWRHKLALVGRPRRSSSCCRIVHTRHESFARIQQGESTRFRNYSNSMWWR